VKQGFVSLIGAGPGHPDYLTVKGLRRIQQAEVILYDALISDAMFSLFPVGCVRLYCGKRCGKHQEPQEEINRRLIHLARKGKRVVRLKGGDPFVFGRGAEEALALTHAGISFEVVPGISAFSGVGSLAGIPLTHRGVSRSVMIIEGHTVKKDPPDWNSIASFSGTIVIYMGVNNIQWIARRLLVYGAKTKTAVAMIETDDEQRQHLQISDLIQVAEKGLLPQSTGPGIIYIGDVVHLAAQIGAQPRREQSNGEAIARLH